MKSLYAPIVSLMFLSGCINPTKTVTDVEKTATDSEVVATDVKAVVADLKG